MKRTLTLIACVAACFAMMISCKNTKTAEPAPEEIQAQKVALADTVLAQIDAIADEFIVNAQNGFTIGDFKLTEKEKLVKPDYLLEPEEANNLVTKLQKVNALAFYIVDLGVREIYEMPLEEAKEAIATLAADVNYPFDDKQYKEDAPISERIKAEYEKCRERDELNYFWLFNNAIIAEAVYILAQNPELYYGKITEEQWQAYAKTVMENIKAMNIIAKYDEEMADLLEMLNQNSLVSSDEEWDRVNASIKSAKQFRIANKDKLVARRNVLIQ